MTVQLAAQTVSIVGLEQTSKGSPASGTIVITGTPADGDTITLQGPTGSAVFEWDSNGSYTSGRTPVTIGGSIAASLANLKAAVDTKTVTTRMTSSSNGVDTLTVTCRETGSGPEKSISKTGTAVTVTGLTGASNGQLSFRNQGETLGNLESYFEFLGDGGVKWVDRYGNKRVSYGDARAVLEHIRYVADEVVEA